MSTLRNLLVLGAYCASSTDAFATSASSLSHRTNEGVSTALRSSYLDSLGDSSKPQPMAESPSPSSRSMPYAEPDPPSIDLNGQIQDRQSNLFRRRDTRSINEDPRQFDMDRRFSQRPAPRTPHDTDVHPRQAWWDAAPSSTIQGSSRRTFHAPYDRDLSHVFLETDGRPLDVEFELWDGPNNTPTRMKVYSEDGRMRPFNAMVENPQKGMRSNTLSVRNTAPMEFPLRAGVGSVAGYGRNGGLAGAESAYMDERDLNGFTRPAAPSMGRGETVQGGALRTFPLDYSVEAVQVTLVTDGLPMNAKVELWGTSTHVKQIAEIYNDNGQTRPFAAIIDTPGGSNTVAIYNTGPMEYPIRAIVEPVAWIDGWSGKEQRFGGTLAPW